MYSHKKHDIMFNEACKHDPTLPDRIDGWSGNSDEITIRLKDNSILAFDGYHEIFYTPTTGGYEYKNNKMDRQAVSMNLPDVMRTAGMTRLDIYYKTGIPVDTITNYTTGRSRPGYTTLIKMCKALNCSPSDLTVLKDLESEE